MHDPKDIVTLSAGALSAGLGGVSLAQLEGVLAIIAALTGISLTLVTFYWRRKEHLHRMGRGPDPLDYWTERTRHDPGDDTGDDL